MRPGNEGELIGALTRATEDGLTVRAVGSGHSFSDLCLTDGCQIDLARMDRLLAVDPQTGIARVQPGMTLRRLGVALHEHGRALTSLGDIDVQTVAGALATGTHGTGARFSSLSAELCGGRLVSADGSVHDPRALG